MSPSLPLIVLLATSPSAQASSSQAVMTIPGLQYERTELGYSARMLAFLGCFGGVDMRDAGLGPFGGFKVRVAVDGLTGSLELGLPHPEPGPATNTCQMVPARGLATQRGINETFPGGPYPLKDVLASIRQEAVQAIDGKLIV